MTYGAGPISLGATARSGLPVTYSVSSGSAAQTAAVVGNQLTLLGAGPVMVTASQAGGGTYAPATSVSQTFIVAPAVLTVTPSEATRVDDTQNPAFSYTIAGFVNSDPSQVVSGTPSLTTTATPSSAPGNYPIVPAQGSLAASNYTFNFVYGNLTVTAGGPGAGLHCDGDSAIVDHLRRAEGPDDDHAAAAQLLSKYREFLLRNSAGQRHLRLQSVGHPQHRWGESREPDAHGDYRPGHRRDEAGFISRACLCRCVPPARMPIRFMDVVPSKAVR